MKSLIVLAVISMVAMARAGTILGGATLVGAPLSTASLVSPLATSLHHPGVLSSPVIASSSWGASPLLTRTVSTHGAWGSPWTGSSWAGSPWTGSPALVAQPSLVHGGLVGARTIW